MKKIISFLMLFTLLSGGVASAGYLEDLNGDGSVNIMDIIKLVNVVLGGEEPTPAPDPVCFVSVCNRTVEVRDKIMAVLNGKPCADITIVDLESITEKLDLSSTFQESGITSLKVEDFNGLSRLEVLDLHNNQISTLPEGIFDELSSLKVLDLRDNQLATLPEGIFDGSSSLERLYISENEISSLPVGIFNELSRLGALFLVGNKLPPTEVTRIIAEVMALPNMSDWYDNWYIRDQSP